jgi:predicted RNase H-like HicB family nuclease
LLRHCAGRHLLRAGTQNMLRIENEQEQDGRWIAEAPALPGVLVYGSTKADANAKAKVLALRVIADRQKKWRANAARNR